MIQVSKNAYAVGALYTVGDLDARLAYGHTNFETNASYAHRLDGVLASLGYKFADFTVTGDFGYAHEKLNDAKPINSTYLQALHIK